MPYVSSTITSGTPVKDLMAAIGTQLTSAGMSLVETYSVATPATWLSVAFGNGVFVAIAQSTATAATSTDGVTWTPRALPGFAAWQTVVFGNGVFLALSNSSTMAATSADGITWTLRNMPSAQAWSTAAYGNGTWVAFATNTAISATSTDNGATWTQRTIPLSLTWCAIAYGAGLFVAVGTSATQTLTSPDGITWTTRSITNVQAKAMIYAGGQFVVVGSSSSGLASADGITWVTKTLPASQNWSSLAYGNGTYLTTTGNALTNAATSPDATTWTARTMPAAGPWNAAAYGNSTFVGVASGSTAGATSADGQTWVLRSMPFHSESPTVDVWKSPAASNSFGQDWYLLLRRAGDTQLQLFYQVAEQYNSSTHRVSNLGGLANTTIPTASTFTNPLTNVSPELISTYGASALVNVTTVAFSYIVSATANRLVLGVKTSAEFGFYCGLYDDLLPTGTTQFPLVAVRAATDQAGGRAIGFGSTNGAGGFTREPLQTVSSAQNFEANMHNFFLSTSGSTGTLSPVTGFTPTSTTGALYGNTTSLSRVPIGSGRTSNFADGLRGLLIGCVMSTQASVIGDVVTAGGKSYARFSGPTSTVGYFVDQAL